MILDCFEHKMWHHFIKMEFQKIANFLDTTSDDKELPRFFTKNWMEVYDQSGGNYNVNKEIRIKKLMLRSDLCDYSDAYIIVKGNNIVDKKTFTADYFEAPNNAAAIKTGTNDANDNEFGEKKLVFKNNASFINCTLKINGVKIDNAEDLDVVIPMYNLLECSKNYRNATSSLWNYYRDDPNSGVKNGITYSVMGSNSFDYKANFIEDDVKNVVPLKYLSNFWKSLNIPLINCEVELILTWFKNCALISKATREADYGANPIVYEIDNPEDATF